MIRGWLRRLRNTRARMVGVSGCGICGDTWDWKKRHEEMFSDNESAFPICEECWQTRSDEEIIAAAERLADQWRGSYKPIPGTIQPLLNIDADRKATAMVRAFRVAVSKRRYK